MQVLPLHTEPSLPVGYETFMCLRSMIISGTLREGDRLVERRLAEELNVSRTPVREALKRLEAEGLVQSTRQGGLVVTSLTEADIREIFMIREVLEGRATYLAAVRRSANELEAMVQLQENLQARADENEADEFWRLNVDFHALVYVAAGSPRLYRMLMDAREYLLRFTRLGFRCQARMLAASSEHREILGLLQAGEASEAEAAARAHTQNSLSAVLKAFSERR